jgi:hypothetical protein
MGLGMSLLSLLLRDNKSAARMQLSQNLLTKARMYHPKKSLQS